MLVLVAEPLADAGGRSGCTRGVGLSMPPGRLAGNSDKSAAIQSAIARLLLNSVSDCGTLHLLHVLPSVSGISRIDAHPPEATC